jgi:hypothetical protein
MGSSVIVFTPYHHCPRNRSWRYFMGRDAKLSLRGFFWPTRSIIRLRASHCPFTKLFSIHSFNTSHSSRYSIRYFIRQCIDIKSFFEHPDYSTSERKYIVSIVIYFIQKILVSSESSFLLGDFNFIPDISSCAGKNYTAQGFIIDA